MTTHGTHTRQVFAGSLAIGGGAPISIQSMTSVPLEDVRATVDQIRRLEAEGAALVRLAVRNEEAVRFLKEVRQEVTLPLSADIHFNHRIAIAAIEAGIDKIRINPGNIGGVDKVKEVVRAAQERGVPIRIGVNGGSLDTTRYPEATPANMVASAMEHVRILEDCGFRDIVVSIKSSDVVQTVEANRLFSRAAGYPLHVGLTEAGYGLACTVHSSVAIGSLLLEGIGDTVRVSMTGDPVEEVRVAKRILEAAGRRIPLLRIVACPTCGRTDPGLDLLALATSVETELTRRFSDALRARGRAIVIAVMGCEVNGPGEAAHADAGVAGGRGGKMLLFARGKKQRMIQAARAVEELASAVEDLLNAGNGATEH
ncbi:MAG: flavodoxin-dependent (E)-4-hydroxy-3-methylbut-2-enyl-diphosphate synthase [Spirochaetes bacterium]|nr:MAG: flavodoxin-dependent (E)-4-hydroxy-3-methylbut-2-enyl-diphosphate synthase [Spirochaetota bacterium]